MTALYSFLTPAFTALGMLAAAGILAALFLHFVAQFILVKGSSMNNTLFDRDVLLAVKPGKYRRGEVVICHYPRRSKEALRFGAVFSLTRHTLFVKRLAALPGDTVEIREGQLFVNDQPVENPVNMASPPRDYPKRKLNGKQYFVIGDNRGASHDSRAADVGPIPEKMLMGHVRFRVWPLKRFGKIR